MVTQAQLRSGLTGQAALRKRNLQQAAQQRTAQIKREQQIKEQAIEQQKIDTQIAQQQAEQQKIIAQQGNLKAVQEAIDSNIKNARGKVSSLDIKNLQDFARRQGLTPEQVEAVKQSYIQGVAKSPAGVKTKEFNSFRRQDAIKGETARLERERVKELLTPKNPFDEYKTPQTNKINLQKNEIIIPKQDYITKATSGSRTDLTGQQETRYSGSDFISDLYKKSNDLASGFLRTKLGTGIKEVYKTITELPTPSRFSMTEEKPLVEKDGVVTKREFKNVGEVLTIISDVTSKTASKVAEPLEMIADIVEIKSKKAVQFEGEPTRYTEFGEKSLFKLINLDIKGKDLPTVLKIAGGLASSGVYASASLVPGGSTVLGVSETVTGIERKEPLRTTLGALTFFTPIKKVVKTTIKKLPIYRDPLGLSKGWISSESLSARQIKLQSGKLYFQEQEEAINIVRANRARFTGRAIDDSVNINQETRLATMDFITDAAKKIGVAKTDLPKLKTTLEISQSELTSGISGKFKYSPFITDKTIIGKSVSAKAGVGNILGDVQFTLTSNVLKSGKLGSPKLQITRIPKKSSKYVEIFGIEKGKSGVRLVVKGGQRYKIETKSPIIIKERYISKTIGGKIDTVDAQKQITAIREYRKVPFKKQRITSEELQDKLKIFDIPSTETLKKEFVEQGITTNFQLVKGKKYQDILSLDTQFNVLKSDSSAIAKLDIGFTQGELYRTKAISEKVVPLKKIKFDIKEEVLKKAKRPIEIIDLKDKSITKVKGSLFDSNKQYLVQKQILKEEIKILKTKNIIIQKAPSVRTIPKTKSVDTSGINLNQYPTIVGGTGAQSRYAGTGLYELSVITGRAPVKGASYIYKADTITQPIKLFTRDQMDQFNEYGLSYKSQTTELVKDKLDTQYQTLGFTTALKQAGLFDQKLLVDQKTLIKQKQVLDQKILLSQKELLKQETRPAQKEILIIESIKEPRSPKKPTPTKIKVPIKFPETPLSRLAKRIEERPERFQAFSRRFGTDKKIGTFATTKEAVSTLIKKLGTTLGASGFIQTDTGRKLKVSELGIKSSAFRTSKKSATRLVERKERRLKKGVSGEVGAIQIFKKKKSTKKKKKKGFLEF